MKKLLKKVFKFFIYSFIAIMLIGLVVTLFVDSPSEITVIEKDNSLSGIVFNSLTEEERITFFTSIFSLEYKSVFEAKKIITDDQKFIERLDLEAKLTADYKSDFYKKQTWWIDINMNTSVADSIAMKIAVEGLKLNWDNKFKSKITKYKGVND
jgi:hypothetical protein